MGEHAGNIARLQVHDGLGFVDIAQVTNINPQDGGLSFAEFHNLFDGVSDGTRVLPTGSDFGSITLDLDFDPFTEGFGGHRQFIEDRQTGTGRDYQIVLAEGANTYTMSFHAFVNTFNPSAPDKDKLTATVDLRISGAVTYA